MDKRQKNLMRRRKLTEQIEGTSKKPGYKNRRLQPKTKMLLESKLVEQIIKKDARDSRIGKREI